MSDALHVKYRPGSLKKIVGQAAAVKALGSIIERKSAQSLLFTGPYGCGKTSLARIAALEFGCLADGIMELPAAVYTGIDDMRSILDGLQYRPFGESGLKCIILDEAHRLSKQAWDSLLKAIEEPPEYVYWMLCTTEPEKIPATIKSRCAPITLKLISDQDLEKLVDRVCKAEGIEISDGIFQLVVREANGSARQALVNLNLCRDVEDRKEAAELLRTALESDPVLELCRYVTAGSGSWMKAMAIVEKLEGQSPEGVRIVVCNYLASVLKNAKSDKAATATLRILDAFASPYSQSEGLAPLFLSIGNALYGG